MSQVSTILSHLKAKPITKVQSLTIYGILNLGDIILKLRHRGYNVVTTMIDRPVGSAYASYRLIKGQVMEFDITKHELSDEDVSCSMANEWQVLIETINRVMGTHLSTSINKQDAIALAKHFKLTTNDIGEE